MTSSLRLSAGNRDRDRKIGMVSRSTQAQYGPSVQLSRPAQLPSSHDNNLHYCTIRMTSKLNRLAVAMMISIYRNARVPLQESTPPPGIAASLRIRKERDDCTPKYQPRMKPPLEGILTKSSLYQRLLLFPVGLPSQFCPGCAPVLWPTAFALWL